MSLTEKFKNLTERFQGDPDALEYLSSRMMKFPEYVNCVVKHVIYERAHSSVESRDDRFRFKLQELDTMRRSAHEVTIDACNQINRFCEMENLPKFCDIDTTDRYQVADFAAQVVIDFFDDDRRYRRTQAKDLVDDMVVYKENINTKDQSIERMCHNAGIEPKSQKQDLDSLDEEDLEL